MKKHILVQYIEMKKEIKETEQRIEELDEKLEKIRSGGSVNDSVKGGYGGKRRYSVKGYPKADDEETEYLLKKYIRLLSERNAKLLEMTISVEQYLNTMTDIRMRRMLTQKYLEGKTWVQVANIMGKHYTADSCQKQVERFWKSL